MQVIYAYEFTELRTRETMESNYTGQSAIKEEYEKKMVTFCIYWF
jgi:hypothetical protein